MLARVHSECFTGDVLGSQRCDCGEQLSQSLIKIAEKGRGILIYVDGHEGNFLPFPLTLLNSSNPHFPLFSFCMIGRGIGLENKLKAYRTMQTDDKIDTYLANEMLGFPAEMRTYETPLAILNDLRIAKINLLSNNPDKFQAFQEKIAFVTPLLCKPNKHNANYLTAKRHRETARATPSSIRLQQQHSLNNNNNNNKPFEKGSKEDLLDGLKKEVALDLPPIPVIEKLRLGIVRTRWNATLVDSLFEGCKESLLASKVQSTNILESVVPGAFELPFAAQVCIFFFFDFLFGYQPSHVANGSIGCS